MTDNCLRDVEASRLQSPTFCPPIQLIYAIPSDRGAVKPFGLGTYEQRIPETQVSEGMCRDLP